MNNHHRLIPTEKQFHCNTNNESRYRINSISDLLRNNKFNIEQILDKRLVYSGKLYTLKDLTYDIRKGYFKLERYCNPHQQLYRIEYVGLEPQIVFLN